MGDLELDSRAHRPDHSTTQGITNDKSYASLSGFTLRQVHWGHWVRERTAGPNLCNGVHLGVDHPGIYTPLVFPAHLGYMYPKAKGSAHLD